MSLLDHPDAQALLADATLSPEAVEGCQDRLTAFLQRYLPRFYRVEHRAHASTVIHGLRDHVGDELAAPRAIAILDSSGFVKKGTASWGVARQWCGRLGKVEN